MTAGTERLVRCTRLAPDAGPAYERFHAAIPCRVDQSLRAAGVTGWRIYVRGDVLTHSIEVEDTERMDAVLAEDPTTEWWVPQVAPFLVANDSPRPVEPFGRLIWDLSWPVRSDRTTPISEMKEASP
jgi:L-rhamnose mutarotase